MKKNTNDSINAKKKVFDNIQYHVIKISQISQKIGY